MINTKISKAQLLTILLFAEKHQQNIFDELGDDVVSIDLDMIDDLIGQLSDSMQEDTHIVILEKEN